LAVALEARRLRKESETAERRERELLAELGERAGELGDEPMAHVLDAQAFEALRATEASLGALETRLARSLDVDREDYASASKSARGWIVLRGICERFALRDRRRLTRRELVERRVELGRAVEEALASGNLEVSFEPERRRELASARTRARAARERRELLLRPHGDRPLPGWAAALMIEVPKFTLFFAKELRAKFLPRLPVVAAMIATWWITRMFTDSRAETWLTELGLRDGASWKVSSETLERLRFWVPLLAAATCGWATEYLGRRIHARYGRAKVESST
jgi:hypothetical protein